MARPIFCAPPVTNATFPASSPITPSLRAQLRELRQVALCLQLTANASKASLRPVDQPPNAAF